MVGVREELAVPQREPGSVKRNYWYANSGYCQTNDFIGRVQNLIIGYAN